jgi:hypothetical protein
LDSLGWRKHPIKLGSIDQCSWHTDQNEKKKRSSWMKTFMMNKKKKKKLFLTVERADLGNKLQSLSKTEIISFSAVSEVISFSNCPMTSSQTPQ